MSCVDPRSDPANCGACGLACGPEGTCLSAGCVCFPLATNCGGDGGVFCPDLASDPENCSACGAACSRCEVCAQSSCNVDPFQAGVLLPLPEGSPQPGVADLIAGDFNGDGIPDLIAIAEYPASWEIVRWSGLLDGGFQVEPPFRPATGFQEVSAKAVDFEGDGVDDLVVLGEAENAGTIHLLVFAGSRSSGLSLSFEAGLQDAGSFPSLAVGDLDGDGRPDIVILSYAFRSASSLASIFINRRDAGFAQFETDPFDDALIAGRVALADMNGDGLVDLVVADENGGAAVAYQLPDGGFLAATTEAHFFSDTSEAIDPYGSTGQEVLVTLPSSIWVLAGDAGGLYVAGSASAGPLASLFSKSAIADLNGDGIPDVANAGSSLGIFLGRGAGFDYGVSDAGVGFSIAVIPGDAGARIAAVDYSTGNGSSVLVFSLPCP